jgi:DNA modification methylase
LLDDNCIDLTVTSPPYDNLRKYKGFEWDFEGVANELYRVTKDGGVVVWIVADQTINGNETGNSFRQALYFKDIGFNLHDTMIYEKHNPVPNANNRYQQSFEFMFVLSKGKPKTTNILLTKRSNECNDKRTFRVKTVNRDKDGEFNEAKYQTIREFVPRRNIWKYKVGLYNSTTDKIAFKHPAIFPEQLASDHILSWSNEGDLVLDPFMGSGTTAKMAKLNNRNYIGFELSEEYCKIAEQRIENATQQLTLF